MSENRARYPIRLMCRLLDVSSSGFHAWAKRPRSKRAIEDAEVTTLIRAAHAASHGTYGAPRIHAELGCQGIDAGRKRIARLMRNAGLAGVSRRRFVTTTVRGDGRQAPDLVARKFSAERPDMLWVADITYVPTWTGFLFLAIVLDAFSRKVIGWSCAATLHTEVVLNAMNMALAQRKPKDVIHHSDQGTQYTSIEFGKRCREAGVRPSMGSVGDAYDNAMAESFFATLECELLDRTTFKSHAQAKGALFQFIEGWYNPRRRHSSLGYLSPNAFEREYAERQVREPGAGETAIALAPVKKRPGHTEPGRTTSPPAVLDRRSTRRPGTRARPGRKDAPGRTERWD